MPDQSSGRRYQNRSAAERRAERRGRLLQAAVEQFSRRGFADTSIEQLCAAARVSTRSFYEEFAGREAILGELHDDLNRRAHEAARRALDATSTDTVADRAIAGLRAYFEVMTEDRAWARVVLIESVGVSPELERRRERALDQFALLMASEARALAAAGVVPDRDYTLTAVALVGAIKELVTAWAVRSRGPTLDEVVDEAVRLTVAAVVSEPAPARSRRRSETGRRSARR